MKQDVLETKDVIDQSPVYGPIRQTSEFADKLVYRMKLTHGARYQAARRHQKRSSASIWAVIFLSMYVFSSSTFTTLYSTDSPPHVLRLVSMMNIVMSAFIIAFSVLEQGKKHDLKADLFLRCAQGIQVLKDELEVEISTGSISKENLSQYTRKYNDIVHDFSDNHSEVDFRTFRINIGKHKGERRYAFEQKFLYWLDCWSMMVVAIFIPPIGFGIIILYY